MELQVLKCPNCGANTTDHKNCEYCGSLLVRFAEKGIEVDTAEFAADAAEYPGLLTELKRNLKLQEENPTEPVATDIQWMTGKNSNNVGILRSGYVTWKDDTRKDSESKSGLMIGVDFDYYIGSSLIPEFTKFNKEEDEKLAKFKKLKSFPLFTSHTSRFKDTYGSERYSREYSIDFGQDAEGAAALISEFLKNVNGLSPSDSFDITTNVGYKNVKEARNAWSAAHGFESENSESTPLWVYISIAIAILCFIITCS